VLETSARFFPTERPRKTRDAKKKKKGGSRGGRNGGGEWARWERKKVKGSSLTEKARYYSGRGDRRRAVVT